MQVCNTMCPFDRQVMNHAPATTATSAQVQSCRCIWSCQPYRLCQLPARPAVSLIAGDPMQMTQRKAARLDPAKLTIAGSLRPEFAVSLPALSLRDRFSPIKLLPVSVPEACHVLDLTCVHELPASDLCAFLCRGYKLRHFASHDADPRNPSPRRSSAKPLSTDSGRRLRTAAGRWPSVPAPLSLVVKPRLRLPQRREPQRTACRACRHGQRQTSCRHPHGAGRCR